MSTPADLPRSVVAFLRSHVDHVVKLRFLLMIHSAPGGSTTVGIVARALDVSKSQARDMANELASAGLLRISADNLELAPISIDDRLALADLADWYTRNRTVVIAALRAMGRADGA